MVPKGWIDSSDSQQRRNLVSARVPSHFNWPLLGWNVSLPHLSTVTQLPVSNTNFVLTEIKET